MIGKIIRFEWRYHTRQISFVAAVLMFALFGFVLTATGFGPDNIHINSPYSIAQSVGILSLLSVFALAVFCANAVVRDREHQMEEIVFTTSVEKLQFLLGRFTGSFLAAFTAFSFSIAGMLIARFMPWHDPDRLGATSLVPYLWSLLVIALPNVLFAAVLLFAFATITRNVLASYAASVGLYILYFVASSLTNSPLMAASAPGANEWAWVAAILDPFALSAFFEQTEHWTAAERNTRLLSLSGNFLWNRMVWVAAAVAGLAVVNRLFAFRVERRHQRRAVLQPASPAGGRAEATPYVVSITDNPLQAYLSATKFEIRAFLLSAPFIALTLLWIGLITSEILSDLSGGEVGTALYPTAERLFRSIGTPLGLIGVILIVYYSAEMVWRERTLQMSHLLHASPAPNGVFVLSKWTTLTALIGVLTVAGVGAGAIVQIVRGYPLDAGAMLAFAYFNAVPLVLFAVIAIVIQTLSPHKYVGMPIVLAALIIGQRGDDFGLEHPLMLFASVSSILYSDLYGFLNTTGFHWSVMYWSAIAGLLLLLAIAKWRPGAKERIGRTIPATLTVVLLATGAVIFYNANVLQAWTTGAELQQWKADYEKKYRPFTTRPQPRISSIRANVDLHPEDGSYRLRGEYVLVNETTQPIHEVLVAVRRDANAATIAMSSAREIKRDERFNQYLITLESPLQPGAHTTLRFDVNYPNRGFVSSDANVVENGSYLMSFMAFPSIGYRWTYEIEDPRERRRLGLGASSAPDQPEIAATDWVDLDLTVSTARDQIAIAPGRLLRDWQQDGRRFFRYKTDKPILNIFSIASARYAVKKETHGGVALELYYHPGHDVNAERILRASKDTLAHLSEAFGPYPHSHLRIVEVPAHWQFGGFATPGVIFLNETRGFLIDARDPRRLDLVYRRVAHEVAHQWWGHTVSAASGPGATTITESLTKYSELLMLEREHGREAVRESLTHELDRYLSGRTGETDKEPPLARAGRQSYLYYPKGAIVMYAIKDLIGEKAVNDALRTFVREQGGPHRNPTMTGLLQTLPRHPLIDEWMNDVVLYDLELESANARKLADGRYEVKMRVSATKQREAGPKLPLRESIDIGMFSEENIPLYVAKHPLKDGLNEVTVIVAKEPAFAAVDPYVTRIDRNRFDNGRDVE
ncbi:MAG TPA: M1 family aminopeptidase [Thermoanaerobaculia bacterium]|jgi:ABC-type transport system involved in multi-copper enzyme maturation permease subunit|nr:M1 family aminopeptidase [Thermoanaerobaculia bacterium]